MKPQNKSLHPLELLDRLPSGQKGEYLTYLMNKKPDEPDRFLKRYLKGNARPAAAR